MRTMVTAIVRSKAGPLALVRTLAPLVQGVVEGALSSVLIAIRPGDEDGWRIAEECGATLIEAGSWATAVSEAAARAGGGLLLVIDAGVILAESFWPELEQALGRDASGPLVTRLEAGSFRDRWRFRLLGQVSPDQAVVARVQDLAGDPWETRLRKKPRVLRTAAFRLAAGQG